MNVISNRMKRCCLFTMSVHDPSDCSSYADKKAFYQGLSRLLRSVHLTNADDFIAQLGYLA